MDDLDIKAIQERVEKRLKERAGFAVHLAIYIGMSLFFWVIWSIELFESGVADEPWPLFPMFIWGIFLVVHGLSTFVNTSRYWENMRERAIQEELQRERERLNLPSKPKRSESGKVARLSDDGELIYEDDEEPRSTAKRR